jgi:hypothetical protein
MDEHDWLAEQFESHRMLADPERLDLLDLEIVGD